MQNKKMVLGRGLSALIGEAGGVTKGTENYLLCPVTDISPNAMQPRKTFDDASLRELSDSIREKGVIEPLIVRRNSNGFELVAGERRWRAAKLAGLKEVPAVVIDATDEESLEFAIIENIQREDLNAIEEAEAYKTLVERFGLSQDGVAKRVGKERATVANYMRLLKLPPEVKSELAKGVISMGHARALLSLESHGLQTELCRKIIVKGLSVREAERLVNQGARKISGSGKKAAPPVAALEAELRGIFGTKVSVKERNGRGSVEIMYYSIEERERIIELLKTISP